MKLKEMQLVQVQIYFIPISDTSEFARPGYIFMPLVGLTAYQAGLPAGDECISEFKLTPEVAAEVIAFADKGSPA